jgi:hypothetical protein
MVDLPHEPPRALGPRSHRRRVRRDHRSGPDVHVGGAEAGGLGPLREGRARADAWELRILAASDDIAETTGARSSATWVAVETREAHGAVRRRASLASAVDERWGQVGGGLESGVLNLAQARVIVEALDALPDELDPAVLARPRPTWSSRPPSSGRASWPGSASAS